MNTMNWMTFGGIIVVSFALTALFVVKLKSRGPWDSGWTFLCIVFLWLTAVSLWIPPAGPVWFGAPWIDLFLTGLLVSFVLAATSVEVSTNSHMTSDQAGNTSLTPAVHRTTIAKAGMLFWMLVVGLCILIIVGFF